MTQQPHARVAVIGAGPSGLYAVAALLASGEPLSVDVLDRLPAPYGLVRYGVAPDHVKMKSVIRVLQRPSTRPTSSSSATCAVGDGGVPVEVLRPALPRDHPRHRQLGGPPARRAGGGARRVARLRGVRQLVLRAPRPRRPATRCWTTPGSPSSGPATSRSTWRGCWPRPAEEMAGTDVPDPVLDALRGSAVTDVHVLIRRGPAARPVHPGRAAPDRRAGQGRRDRARRRAARGRCRGAGGQAAAAEPRDAHRVGRAAARPAGRAASTCGSCAARCGSSGADGRVSGVVVERNVIERRRAGASAPASEETLDVGLVVRAIGYAAEPVPGLPFDAAHRHRAQRGGRVVRDGVPVPGAYVTGWIKRGPTGVIGTNKGDATETVAALLADLPALPAPPRPSRRRCGQAGRARGAPGGLDGLAAPRRRGDPPRRAARRRAGEGRRAGRDARPRRTPRRAGSSGSGPWRPAQQGSTDTTAFSAERRSAKVAHSAFGERDRAGHGAVGHAVADVDEKVGDRERARAQGSADVEDALPATGGDDLVPAGQARGPGCAGGVVENSHVGLREGPLRWGPEPGLGRTRGSGAPAAWLSRRAAILPRQERGRCACDDDSARHTWGGNDPAPSGW